MSDVAIKVESLSKQYRLGEVGTGTLSHDLNRWWHLVRGKPDPYLKIGEKNTQETSGKVSLVWALKDINFEVKEGEILGIILWSALKFAVSAPVAFYAEYGFWETVLLTAVGGVAWNNKSPNTIPAIIPRDD